MGQRSQGIYTACSGCDHTPCVEGMGLSLHTHRLLRNNRKRGSRVVSSRCNMKSISEDAILDTIALQERRGHIDLLTLYNWLDCGSRVVLNHFYHHFLRIQTHSHLQTHRHIHTVSHAISGQCCVNTCFWKKSINLAR